MVAPCSVGAEALAVFEDIATEETVGLAAESSALEFPTLTFDSEEEARQAVDGLQKDLERLESEGAGAGGIQWCRTRLDRATKSLESLTAGHPLPPVVGEIVTIRFGNIAVVMTPGEIFNEIGGEVKQCSPIANTLFVGYSNGTIGYVPTPGSYPEGGYEVTHACRVGPQAAGMLKEEALRQLREVFAK